MDRRHRWLTIGRGVALSSDPSLLLSAVICFVSGRGGGGGCNISTTTFRESAKAYLALGWCRRKLFAAAALR